jgi:hypothetical protein
VVTNKHYTRALQVKIKINPLQRTGKFPSLYLIIKKIRFLVGPFFIAP